ncbi:MAG TPA: glycosyltransferase family 2 protein [Flavobacterium sp.]|nr:glycosyltransferase family 2 protein [Flavobacterium sp.]
MITIFTPTFNRAYLLNRVYQSILAQTNNTFEWIIVDDGSIDDTEQLVQTFLLEQKIAITYHKQENKGKHFAINKGVQLANGSLFLILDSDDVLPNDTVEFLLSNYAQIIDDSTIGGIAGRRNTADGTIVGSNNFNKLISNSIDIRYKYKVTGDLVEVFKTEVLKEIPFPEIENEKFCPEVLVWNRIAQKYNLLFINKGIYTTEYLPDGLTAKIVKIRMTSPIASMLTYSELASCNIPLLQKIRATINFWRFAFNSKSSFLNKWKKVNPFFSIITLPIGYLMFQRDVRKYMNQ